MARPPEIDELDSQLNSSAPLDPAAISPPAPAGVEAAPSGVTSQSAGGGAAPGPAAPSGPDKGGMAAAAVHAAQSVMFNFGDEAAGLYGTLFGSDEASFAPQTSVWASGKSFGDTFAANVARQREALAQSYDQHKAASWAGTIGGAVLIPFGSGAKGALAVAKVGAVQGAISGAGEGEDLQSRATGAVEGAGLGAAFGAVLGKVTEAGGKLIGKLRGKTPEAPVEATPPEAVPMQVTPEDNQPIAGQTEDGRVLLPARIEPKAPEGEAPVGETTTPSDQTAKPTEEAPAAPAQEIVPLHDPETGKPAGDMDRDMLVNLQARIHEVRDDVNVNGPEAANMGPEEPQGQWTMGNLGNGDGDTTGLLRAVADTVPPKVTKSDAELMTAAHAHAGAMGEDAESILAASKEMAGKLGDADTMMATLRTVWARAAREVSDWGMKGVDWSTATPEAVESAATSIRNMKLLSWHVQQAKVGLGRGLRVSQLPDADTYLQRLLENDPAKMAEVVADPGERSLPLLPRSPEEIGDFFNLWHALDGNPKAQADFLSDGLSVPKASKYLRTSIANFFTASILSAPRTIGLNVIGPAFINTLHNIERMSGAYMMALNPMADAATRAEALAVAKQTPIAFMQMFGDIKDVFSQAQKSAAINRTLIGGGGQSYDALTSYGPFTPQLLNAANIDPAWQYSLGNAINWFPRQMARLNNGLDEFSKRLTYQGEVRVRALVDASTQGLDKAGAADLVSSRLRGSYDEAGAATDEALLRTTERTTLTSTPGDPRGWVRRASVGFQALRRDIPEMRFIIPVFNVPANGLGEVMRRLPIAAMAGSKADMATGGLLNYLFRETAEDLAGQNGVVAQAEAHGRTLLGAAFLSAGIMMNKAGYLTGAGPQDTQDRRTWLQTHQPYSILIDGNWVRYDKFDLAGGLLSIPGTIADATTYQNPDQHVGDIMMSGVGALSQWFKDRASLRQAITLLNFGNDPTQNAGSTLTQFTGNIAQGFVPAAFQATVTDVVDPVARMRHDWLDYIKAAVPGLSQQLEPVRNVMGEAMPRAQSSEIEAFLPITMAHATTWKDDPELDELDRLYKATGYGAGADPKSLGFGYFDPKEVKLEDGRSLFDHAVSARQTVEVGGVPLRQALKDLFASDAYNSAVDSADADHSTTSLGDGNRGYMVKRLFGQYNNAIKATLASTSPIADAYLTAAAAKQRDSAYLEGLTADDLVKDNTLYGARGVNSGLYSDKIKRGGSQELLQALGQ